MNDVHYMKLAISLASSAKGQTSPNPIVGSVVVKNGEIVGFGAHLKAGEPHAEVHALKMAGDKAEGATVYVTLEPCSHYGKTPPCAELLIEKKVSRVVIASVDPNPLVAGKGIKMLKDAGIIVEAGVEEESALALNEVFFHYIQTNRPFVTLKTGVSLDGKTATVTGESKWITSPEARLDAHEYRHQHDAILVGVGTVKGDDPSLTTRLPAGGKNPIRIILDNHLNTPLSAKVVNDKEAPTWIVTSNNVAKEKLELFQNKPVEIISLPTEKVEIGLLLEELGSRKITSLFVEGGATVNGSFVQANAVNQFVAYIAPKLIGGKLAPTSVGGLGIESMDDIVQLQINEVKQIGSDVKIVAVPLRNKEV
ncbi:bifunctional diaminohydroxyphosphoribosylaminopyrimidine deaminase/5-amino-6-(5-phosphoribosylamino)uracil reductase RibD [Sutcliffiella sp. NC1]|uniref:bifunctional diaminohydroxyphosphoribosylaminopyrimidine deaminase/5-amino-6-(5-phosphoribosylamino)uracil reductase RibD n=1 Tax=Sutcliffiella sp. NC1 TaxID=3004096 RepID=UPI0022DE2C3C|nr:bifunctional diaminohydroxyphosphoribosylaminopyrimidine deaminase/5-amino-6-(5-phosphoribosylamino)uracil reductase RibD [Sutcliffiella sp. NC1]WBL13540.1 bifunctional diaminohydroxyphosphoribosylaminopyrimidine deaminase/5-amino-6-(5-phosphoribosylamino)uracil reductase RibD [Sutcliffiella sp. NC1]